MTVHPDNEELNAFSSIDIVSQCLVDEERTEAFGKAIKATVKEGDRVLDLGTGSSILSLFAAQAGAKKVIAIEFDPYIGRSAYQVIKVNGLEDIIEIRIADARNCIFPADTKFDVVIVELITTGMIDEHQIAAINNLYEQKVVDEKTRFLPSCQKTFITLGDFDFETYGFNVPFVRHLWKFHKDEMKRFKPLAHKILLNSFDFSGPVSEEFSFSDKIKVKESGIINAVHFSSITELGSDLAIGETDAINGPVVVPIEPVTVSAGQEVKLSVNYLFGGGFESVKIFLTT